MTHLLHLLRAAVDAGALLLVFPAAAAAIARHESREVLNAAKREAGRG